MGQSIQEWTKQTLWKTAIKNLKRYGLLIFLWYQPIMVKLLLRINRPGTRKPSSLVEITHF